MTKLRLKISKSGRVNPHTKTVGFSARVITNGTATFEEIAAEACRNTTIHKAEAKVAIELCMESVAEMLKQGYIIDLGPAGKLYPSCTSKWVENAEDLTLADVTPKLNYRPADDIASAIKGATLRWAKASEATDENVVDDDGEDDGPSMKPVG